MELKLVSREQFIKYIPQFASLYQLCFGVAMDQQEVQWRYLENPMDKLYSCMAFEKERLIANYSVSPIELIQDGQVYQAALSLNTMTHPDYIGKGLFVKLAQQVYRQLEQDQFCAVIGFPNKISHRTFINKLDWQDIQEIPMLECDMHSCVVPDVQHEPIVEDSAFLYDYSRCIASGRMQVRKNAEYLRWRFYKHPANRYYNYVIAEGDLVYSRIICKEYKNRLNIVDAFFANDLHAEQLLTFVQKKAIEQGKDNITAWCNIGSFEHTIFEKKGFCNTAPVTYFGGRSFAEGFLDDLKWKINLCDDNVY